MGSHSLIGMLADPERLRVVAALALGAGTRTELVERTGLDLPSVAGALRRLEASGLVSVRDRIELHAELFGQLAREQAPRPEPVDSGISDPATAAVLRAFVRDGRLQGIPAAAGKRQVLLEYLVEVFEPGVRYPEKEVNALLRAWHDDHAALRRYLVDAGLLSREAGEYWRTGGAVSVDPVAPVPRQRVAVYGLASDADRVLLTRLGRGWHAGRWTLPGGGLDFGERPVQALHREVYEETGLTVQDSELLDVDAELLDFEWAGGRVVEHPVRILYRVTTCGGPLGVREVGGSTSEVAWLSRDDLAGLAEEDLTPYTLTAMRIGRLAPATWHGPVRHPQDPPDTA